MLPAFASVRIRYYDWVLVTCSTDRLTLGQWIVRVGIGPPPIRCQPYSGPAHATTYRHQGKPESIADTGGGARNGQAVISDKKRFLGPVQTCGRKASGARMPAWLHASEGEGAPHGWHVSLLAPGSCSAGGRAGRNYQGAMRKRHINWGRPQIETAVKLSPSLLVRPGKRLSERRKMRPDKDPVLRWCPAKAMTRRGKKKQKNKGTPLPSKVPNHVPFHEAGDHTF